MSKLKLTNNLKKEMLKRESHIKDDIKDDVRYKKLCFTSIIVNVIFIMIFTILEFLFGFVSEGSLIDLFIFMIINPFIIGYLIIKIINEYRDYKRLNMDINSNLISLGKVIGLKEIITDTRTTFSDNQSGKLPKKVGRPGRPPKKKVGRPGRPPKKVGRPGRPPKKKVGKPGRPPKNPQAMKPQKPQAKKKVGKPGRPPKKVGRPGRPPKKKVGRPPKK